MPVLLCIGATPAQLREDPLVWTRIAVLGPWLILPGLWGAIFSSAVGSMLGAPRTLQALAFDRLVPRQLAKTAGRSKEPVYGMAVTLALALGAIFLGDLNTVAEVVTMFFLTVYGTVSLVAALESLSGNPSWRPRIQVPWWLSLAGAAGLLRGDGPDQPAGQSPRRGHRSSASGSGSSGAAGAGAGGTSGAISTKR